MALRQITQALLNNLRTGFKTDFQRGLDKVEPTFMRFSTKVNSTTKIETYGWLGDFPRFRKWVGAKVIKRMKEKAYRLVNDDYEVTRGIKKRDIEDDNLGLWGPQIEGWGEEAQALPDRLAYDALANGHQAECYDGQNFFDDEHPMAGAAVSNISAAGGSQPWYLLVTNKSLKPILIQEREKPHFHMVTSMEDSRVFETGEYLAGGEVGGDREAIAAKIDELIGKKAGDMTPPEPPAFDPDFAGVGLLTVGGDITKLQSPEGPDANGDGAAAPSPAADGKADGGTNAAPAVEPPPASDASAAPGEQYRAGADALGAAPAAGADAGNQPEDTQQPPVAEPKTDEPERGAAAPAKADAKAKPRGSSGRQSGRAAAAKKTD